VDVRRDGARCAGHRLFTGNAFAFLPVIGCVLMMVVMMQMMGGMGGRGDGGQK
jgi:hypothetical protein